MREAVYVRLLLARCLKENAVLHILYPFCIGHRYGLLIGQQPKICTYRMQLTTVSASAGYTEESADVKVLNPE